MKAILMSIKPQWVGLILNGIKKDEVRKGTTLYKAINKLIAEQGVAPMLIYCTKNDKQVLFGRTRDIELVDYRGTACYGDFRLLRKGDKLTTDDNQPRLNGKVVARFNATAEEIKQRIGVFWAWGGHPYYTDNVSEENLLKRSCLSATELENYLQGKIGTDIHITNLEIFDRPKEISEFIVCLEKKHKCRQKFSDYPCKKCVSMNLLTCAPQSWQFIEV